jgi:hypothetical protein
MTTMRERAEAVRLEWNLHPAFVPALTALLEAVERETVAPLREALEDIARRLPPVDVLDAVDDDAMTGHRVVTVEPRITIADARRIHRALAPAREGE